MPNNSDQTPSQLCKDDKLKGLFAAPPTPAPAPVPASAPAPTPSPAPTPTTGNFDLSIENSSKIQQESNLQREKSNPLPFKTQLLRLQ